MIVPSALDCVVVLSVIAWFRWLTSRRRSGLPYPPGPKRIPILGNILQTPNIDIWKTAKEWGKDYGAIASPLE